MCNPLAEKEKYMDKWIATEIRKLKIPLYILIFILGVAWLTALTLTRDLLGDVNNDGIINVQDIIRVLNIILEY